LRAGCLHPDCDSSGEGANQLDAGCRRIEHEPTLVFPEILTMARRTHETLDRMPKPRHGLSLLEFIGCLIAVVGGMWLGAIYLGINVEAAAFNALYDAELLDAVPEAVRPETPEGHPSQFTEEEFNAALQTELKALRHEITALRETTDRRTAGKHDKSPTAAPGGPTRKQTLAYWNRLRNIAQDEAGLQTGTQAALSHTNADHAFALRGRVSQFAAKAVEAIPTEQVDSEALQLGQQLADWYVKSGNLYQQAARLWSDRNAQQSAAQLTRQWETSERQLQNEGQLLVNKAASVQASLSRRYKGEFPAFGD
jgi:hypothetical protein